MKEEEGTLNTRHCKAILQQLVSSGFYFISYGHCVSLVCVLRTTL